jgi:hypothetical protein
LFGLSGCNNWRGTGQLVFLCLAGIHRLGFLLPPKFPQLLEQSLALQKVGGLVECLFECLFECPFEFLFEFLFSHDRDVLSGLLLRQFRYYIVNAMIMPNSESTSKKGALRDCALLLSAFGIEQ